MNRYAIVAASLLCSTVSFAQTSALGNAPSSSSAATPNGVFRPAGAAPELSANKPALQAAQPAATVEPTQVFSIGKEYRVGANDLLEIEVMNLDLNPTDYRNNGKRLVRVNAAGTITMPLIGVVTVAGLTQQEAEAHIAALYGDKYLQDPQVSLFIREFTTERITVDGAVVKPGIYPLVGQMTLLRALALAGGFGQLANMSEVKLFRKTDGGEREVATFNVERIRSGKDLDPLVRGDDVVVVQRDSTRALLKDSVLRDVLDYLNPFSVFAR